MSGRPVVTSQEQSPPGPRSETGVVTDGVPSPSEEGHQDPGGGKWDVQGRDVRGTSPDRAQGSCSVVPDG